MAASILQVFTAEALCSLWAGKFDARERRVMASWKLLDVNPETRQKIHEEQLESHERILKLAAEGAKNLAESGEAGVSLVVGSFGFERSCMPRVPYPLAVKTD